jgi:uncharacterized cupredoxin-like copper-binding protein
MRISSFLVLTVFASLLTVAVACGDDDDGGNDGGEPSATQQEQSSPTEATAGGEATAVDVSLGDFFVVAEPASVPAGTVTFVATNNTTECCIGHEIVVMRTDLPLEDLPVTGTGAVDEMGEGIEVIGATAKLSPGSTKELTVDLEAGRYGLVCNIYVEELRESHYQKGMWSEFIVE